MQQRSYVPVLASLALATVTLSGCGGGGSDSSGGGGTPTATISTMSVNATKYTQAAVITINGTGLDSTLSLTSSTCSGMTMLTTAPTVSTSTTAYYACTVGGALTRQSDGTLAGTVIAKSNGTQIKTASFSVPQPVVTLAINNGAAVNGVLTVTLAADKAPATVTNFLAYVNSGFYNGTIFHRDVANFVMQAGGFASPVSDINTATLKPTTYPPIAVETTGLSNLKYSIAMANANTSTNVVTTTSQFYFNIADNTNLDGNYAVFGAITANQALLQTILNAPANCTTVSFPSGASETDCLPVPNAVITSASQIQ